MCEFRGHISIWSITPVHVNFFQPLPYIWHYKMLPAVPIKSFISPKSSGSFQWIMLLETNIQVLGVLAAPGECRFF